MTAPALKVALAVAALAGAAPAFAQEPPFEPTGELRFVGRGALAAGAAFDETRVVGPAVNMTKRDDGSWAGDLLTANLDLEVTPTGVRAPNVNLQLGQKAGRTTIEGLFYGQRVRVEIDRKRLRGRFGACSMDMARKGAAMFRGDVGCMRPEGPPISVKSSIELIGTAAAENPPLPQFALALLAVLPG
jgi:hypothetical protein